jgi:hypothetical protein
VPLLPPGGYNRLGGRERFQNIDCRERNCSC